RRRQRCAWNEAKPRVPDPRAEQLERLAANEAGCARISLRCASMRRKIALNSPGSWGMSAKMPPVGISSLSWAPDGRTGCQRDEAKRWRLRFKEETETWHKKVAGFLWCTLISTPSTCRNLTSGTIRNINRNCCRYQQYPR